MGLQEKRCTLESKSDQNQDSAILSNHRNVSLLYKNADILFNKTNKLYHYITSVNPNVMCITEVLPQNTSIPVDECKFYIAGFDCFRSNSSFFHGGI